MDPAEGLETTPERSRLMSKIKSKDTKPELLMREALLDSDFEYHPEDVLHKPDLATMYFPRTAVFVDGCFWHKCPEHYREPKTNRKYWIPKIDRNVERDSQQNKDLVGEGFLVIRVWEHSINEKSAEHIAEAIEALRQVHATTRNLKVVRI